MEYKNLKPQNLVLKKENSENKKIQKNHKKINFEKD